MTMEIDIRSEQDGDYISLEQAKAMWFGNGSSPTPGQHPNPLLQLTFEQITQAKLEFDLELEALQKKYKNIFMFTLETVS